jgi:hypothetical protein
MSGKEHFILYPGLIAAAAAAGIVIAVIGCGKAKTEKAAETSPAVTETETTLPETSTVATASTAAPTTAALTKAAAPTEDPNIRKEVNGQIASYLTGEMKDVNVANRRPVAFMMSNDKAARPQYGINRAGVVYEAPIEGEMNRFMSIMEEYDDLPRIGSSRSMRTYYTYFAHEWDAITVHYGQSTFAKPYLKNNDDVNGIESIGYGAFYRTSDKRSPHNAYTSGEKLNAAIAKFGYRETYDPSYNGHFKFSAPDKQLVPENSMDAFTVQPGYWYNKPQFDFNRDDGLYYRSQYGVPHMGDEGQIAVKNIILQYAAIGNYATTDYLDINVHDDSYGFYITNGKAIPVTVKKDGEFGLTKFFDQQGKEITLNTGKTWICIIDSRKFYDTVIMDEAGNRTNADAAQ